MALDRPSRVAGSLTVAYCCAEHRQAGCTAAGDNIHIQKRQFEGQADDFIGNGKLSGIQPKNGVWRRPISDENAVKCRVGPDLQHKWQTPTYWIDAYIDYTAPLFPLLFLHIILVISV